MPILAPSQPPPPPPRPPRVEERLAVTWYAPDGREWPLVVPRGAIRALATNALSSAVPIEVTRDANPRGGVDIRHTHELERYLLLPTIVQGANHMDMITRWRDLGDAITQTTELGPGVLRVTQPDGSWRDIEAVYMGGWEGLAEQGWDWDIASALTLLAPRPWWRGPSIPPIRREVGTQRPFLNPFMTVSSSRVLGDTEIVNPGESTAWPSWTITGPMDRLTAINHRTGQQWILDPDWAGGGPLGAGAEVTIQTDPTRIRGPLGEVWTGAVTGELWGLARGRNRITFTADAAAGAAAVELTYRPLYQTA